MREFLISLMIMYVRRGQGRQRACTFAWDTGRHKGIIDLSELHGQSPWEASDRSQKDMDGHLTMSFAGGHGTMLIFAV